MIQLKLTIFKLVKCASLKNQEVAFDKCEFEISNVLDKTYCN